MDRLIHECKCLNGGVVLTADLLVIKTVVYAADNETRFRELANHHLNNGSLQHFDLYTRHANQQAVIKARGLSQIGLTGYTRQIRSKEAQKRALVGANGSGAVNHGDEWAGLIPHQPN
jgi:hypothetical protein